MTQINSSKRTGEYKFLFIIVRDNSDVLRNDLEYTYSIRSGMDTDRTNAIVRQLVREMDSDELVRLEHLEPKKSSTPIIQRRATKPIRSCEFIFVCVLEEDYANLGTDKPVHFLCSTAIDFSDKDEFIRVINFFVD